jgi:formylmethanofuran dehydrogenase subunit C
MRMRGGLIAIRGQARDFTGLQMKGGAIVLMEGAEIRTGAWMNKGRIISMKPLQMMPTFNYASDREPSYLSEQTGQLNEFGINVLDANAQGAFRQFCGDLSVSDKGEILVWQPSS